MKLNPPFLISSRLLPAVKIEGATISIEKTTRTDHYGKPVWKWYVDMGGGAEFEGDDLAGRQGTQGMMASLLAFMATCGEAYRYDMGHPGQSENLDLFPGGMREWCYINSDELSTMQVALEETENLIEE